MIKGWKANLMLYVLIFITIVIKNSFAMTNDDAFIQSLKLNAEKIKKDYSKDINELISQSSLKPSVEQLSFFSKTKPISLFNHSTDLSSSAVYVFVSFSMPETSLKQWISQATQHHANVIIRGLVNNSFKDTARVLAPLLTDNKGGVLLDPTLFRRFAIEQVPAVVLSENNTCLDNKNCYPMFDVIYGDVSLEYALSKLHTDGDVSKGNYHVN